MANFFLRLRYHLKLRFGRHYTATICGHTTTLWGPVTAFGQTVKIEMPLNEDGEVDYCLGCIGRMACKCAWCGNTIFIGDPVTLYVAPTDLQVPDYAVVFSEKPLQLVGCLGWNCANSGADRAGFWLPSDQGGGHVELTQSLFALATQAHASVLANDLSDPTEKPTLGKARQ